MVPILMGHRHWTTTEQPYARNPFGHQGLYHDEEADLIYNRARMLHPRLARFTQRDPLGYVDGMSAYAYYAGMRAGVDPYGLFWGDTWVGTFISEIIDPSIGAGDDPDNLDNVVDAFIVSFDHWSCECLAEARDASSSIGTGIPSGCRRLTR